MKELPSSLLLLLENTDWLIDPMLFKNGHILNGIDGRMKKKMFFFVFFFC